MQSAEPVPDPTDRSATVSRNARYGIILFIIYLIVYAAFVAVSAFKPSLMAQSVLGGVNLAVVYGLGLIALALILAIIYMALCRGGGSE